MVRTGAASIPTGGLVLVPVVSFANITTKEPSSVNFPVGELDVGGTRVKYFMTPPPKPPLNSDTPTEINPESIVSAFWWVSTTHTNNEANMQVEEQVVRGVAVPILKNIAPLAAHTKLFRHVPAPKPKASSIDGLAPKKKQRS